MTTAPASPPRSDEVDVPPPETPADASRAVASAETEATTEQAPADRPSVLMLTHRMPYPPDRGDRIRSYHMIRTLAQHFDMALACPSEEKVWLQHHQLLRKLADRCCIMPTSPTAGRVRALGALLTRRAVTPAVFYRASLAQQISMWQDKKPFDAVLTFCTGMIPYARLLVEQAKLQGRPLVHVLDLVDVDSLKWEAYAREARWPMSWVYGHEAKRLREIEAGRFDHLAGVTVVSDAEAEAYRTHVAEHPALRVVRNGVDTDYFHPLGDCDETRVVFTGVLNYRPNVDAVTWFAHEVLPALREKVPTAVFRIVGRHPSPSVQELSAIDGVELIGSTPDVRDHLACSAAAVAPLRIARGTQNKVLEAMASQRAVVCSQAAASGVDASNGEHIIEADTPEQWVKAIERLFQDGEARRQLAAAARQRVETHYGWDAAMAPMVELVRDAVRQARAA